MNPLIHKIQDLFQRALEQNPKAHTALEKAGIQSGEFALKLGLGYTDVQTLKVLSKEESLDAMKLNILGERGTDKLKNSLTLPLYQNGEVTGFCGKSTVRQGKVISGRKEGLHNEKALENKEVIIMDNFVQYLMMRQFGIEDVLFFPGIQTPDYLQERLKASRVQKIYACSSRNAQMMIKALEDSPAALYRISLDPKKTMDQEYVQKARLKATQIKDGTITQKETGKETKEETEKKEGTEGSVTVKLDHITYKAQPLKLNVSTLKVILTAELEGEKYIDRIDLYLSVSRKAFAKSCSEKFGDDVHEVENDLTKVIEKLEELRDKESPTEELKIPTLSKTEESEGVKTLRNKKILDEWLSDCRKIGYVGEDQNLQLGLLAVVSRLLSNPLSVIFKSSPASGKSYLLELFCSVCPPESLQYSSKLTSASLYYANDLKHKLVAVDEAHGVSDVLYPLRSLISSKKLALSAPVKDPGTGATITKTTYVYGPIAYMESTTEEIHEENLSRAILLGLDESTEQTLRILDAQRKKAARDYEDISEPTLKKWQNIMRLIAKYRKSVVIPYVDKLRFPPGPNSRRDFQKLLSLIQAVTLLRVLQRPTEKDDKGEYLAATLEDYETIYSLYAPLMINPQDELSERARSFLEIPEGPGPDTLHQTGGHGRKGP